MTSFRFDDKKDDRSRFASNAVIKVIGVGGGGGNALNTMIESGLSGVEFIAANTDVQALQANLAPIKIQLGKELTKGLGAGANPETGRNAALEDKAILQEVLSGADMVFVTGGMGGGTGTGAAPIIAQVAREIGALTVGVVTKPFGFEGKRRKQQSEIGIQALRQSVDTLITIPNQRLLSIAPPEMSMLEGFKLADEVLLNAVKGISDIINIPGRVNVDFADVKTIMSEMGMALMGIGTGRGPNRAAEAARAAISSPLLEDIDIEGATGILINISGTSSMTLHEISEASTLIQEAAHEDANIIFGAVIDENMGDTLRVTVIATGFDQARVAYPDQNFSNAGQQNQFMHHNVPIAAQGNMAPQQFSTHNPPRGNSGGYNPNNQPPQGSPFDQRPTHGQQGNQGNYNPVPQSPFMRQQQHFAQGPTGQQTFHNNHPQQNTPQRSNEAPTQPQGFRAQNSLNQPAQNSGYQNKDLHPQPWHLTPQPRSVLLEHEDERATVAAPSPVYAPTVTASPAAVESDPATTHVEGRIGAFATQAAEDGLDNTTERALKLAKELADLEDTEEADFETPTFMRKKEESHRVF